MYRAESGHANMSSSGRPKECSSSGSRSSRSGASASSLGRGRSPRRSRSPSPRGRRHRSPSSSRSSRRSPSPRRSSRRRSPGRRSRSPRRRSCSPERRSLSRHSESSVEQSLRITVGNDRYGIETPERKRLSDRLGSPVDSLSDVDRDDLADGPIFRKQLSHPRSLEQYPSHEENPYSPYHMRHEDYHSRDVFIREPGYAVSYDHLQEQSRETGRDVEPLRKSLYSSEDGGRELKRSRYARDDRLIDMNTDTQGFTTGTRNYRKRSLSRSPSRTYLDEEFRELESARRKRKEEALRNLNRELPGNGYMTPDSANTMQSSEHRYLYRPDEAPVMPKKSILKKRVDDTSVQPEVFSSGSVEEPPLLSDPPPLPFKRSTPGPFALEVENFLKRFNKNAVAELAAHKESKDAVQDWRSYPGQNQSSVPFEQNSGSFLAQKEHNELKPEPVSWQNDFLLPHERASQDGSGFSHILSMMADSTQEKRRRSFPADIEDEEKFLYGDYEDDSDIKSLCAPKVLPNTGKEPASQKAISSPPDQSVKADLPEEPRPAYEKIHDLLKTIGLDIGVAEIGKLAARTQERLHGKKSSLSPDGRLVSSHKSESQERQYSRSNTHSPESSRKRSLSPPNSFPPSKDTSSLSKPDHNKNKTLRQDNSSSTPEGSIPPIAVLPSAPPSLCNVSPPASVSQYNVSHFPPFTAAQLPPNYPSPTMPLPGYDAYRHYMAYATSGWPMYAQQPDPALSDIHGLASLAASPNPTRPNLRVIETVSTAKVPPTVKQDESVHMHIPSASPYSKILPQYTPPSFEAVKERISDERNRASQKQKVIEERENLKIEQEARQKKLHYLKTELNRLSKQQGEMLRKKRREKDGHKDPLLVEVNCLQENIVKEIAQLKMSFDAAEKKQSELDKVAQILGINIFEKSRKSSSENKDSLERNRPENAKTQERTSGSVKESKATSDKPKAKSPKPKDSSSQPSKQLHQGASIYNYYDTGNHWCKDCNTICGTMFDFFTHMHNKKHRQTLDPYNRPWAKAENEVKQEVVKHSDKIPVPAKGSEFLIPVTGYYCQLCHEFFGDQISAEQHVKSHPHNEKYKKHIDENPLYEERRNLDRQAGLSVIQETERRLKRKQCEKQKEEKDEKPVKVAKKEEPKTTKELKDVGIDHDTSKKNEDPNGQKSGTKLRLTKDDKEVEKKDGRKEESLKDSRLSSFGKFSWRKTEKDEKSQGKEAASPMEESAEECKDKENKSQIGKTNSKSIAIKLSGKTVIPHTSPWMPVLSASAQSKIRPNLPVPTVVLRKFATATVSKPAPLNTFLSIKSSGATTKPLPVVKEGSPGIVLSPDIVSKVFGGEGVVLNENAKWPEQEQDSVTKAIEHAKALEHVKQAAEAKERELAAKAKEQEMMRMAKRYHQSPLYDRSYQCPPLLLLPPRSPLVMAQAFPPPPPPPFPPPQTLLPPKQIILADDMAPGVSEDDKNILAMPMCPHPLPPPNVFGDHVQKLEKKLTPLAAGNAQDLYDIFYNSNGRNPADNRLVSSATSDKGKLNPDERGQKTEQLLDSKPSNSAVSQDALCNAYSSSDVSNISLDNGTLGKEEVGTEKYSAASKENTELKSIADGESGKILSTTDCVETSVSNDLPTNAPASFQNKEEIEIPFLIKISKETPQLGKAELVIPLSESSVSPLENDSEKASELEETEHLFSDVNNLAVQMSDCVAAPSEDVSKKPLKFETSEFVMPFSECSVPSLKDNEKPSELETTECKSPGDKESTVQLLEYSVTSLEAVTKEPLNLETVRLAVHLLGNSTTPLEELDKNPSTLETIEDKLTLQLSEESACPLENTGQIQGLNSPYKDLLGQLPEESTDFANESVIMRDVGLTGDKDTNEKLQNEQTIEEEGTLGSIFSTNVKSSSNEELIFTKNSTHGSSISDVKLNDMKGTDLIETKNASYCSVQSQMIEESLGSVPSEINGGNFEDKALTFTDTKPEDLNTSADADFKLNPTNSELNFDHPTSLTLTFNTENESMPVKSGEIHSTDLPRLTSTLEIETVDFSLGDVEGEREPLDLLPSEILHEDTVDSPKLASVIPVCLEPNKGSQLDIGQPIDEPEIIGFVALTSGNQEDTFCSLVYDAVDPHAVSPSNEDTAESNMPLTEMQAVSSVSKVLQVDAGKYVTSDAFLNSDGKYVQNQETTTCMESLLPVLKETLIELGGSGDNELCTVNKEMQNSGGEPTKTEGEGNDSMFEIKSKLTSDVPESSTEQPLL